MDDINNNNKTSAATSQPDGLIEKEKNSSTSTHKDNVIQLK